MNSAGRRMVWRNSRGRRRRRRSIKMTPKI
jgi:hypothetical protein